MTEDLCSALKKAVKWWRKSGKRNYPWRKRRDLYGVLIAEILLTRTPRGVVAKIYEDLMSKYPTPESMAEADEVELKSIFSSLGLYKRGVFLKNLASFLSSRRNVSSWEELMNNVKGVGRYIAKATFAIAKNEPLIALDSPTRRLVSRLIGRELKKNSKETERVEEELSECAEKSGLGGSALLSLVDLANEICKPTDPICPSCPLSEVCSYARRKKGGR